MLDHVEVVGFFVVSGFLIKNMEKPGDYVCKSASRLLIPFIVFDLLYIIILSTIGREWGQGIRNMQDLKWSIIAPGNGPIWFLRALFVSSIAYAVLKKYILVKIPIWLAGIITLIISVSAFIPADIARNQTAEGLVNGGGNTLIVKYIQLNIASGIGSICWLWLGDTLRQYNLPHHIATSRPIIFHSILVVCMLIWSICSLGHIDISRSFIADKYSFYPAAAAGTCALFLCAWKLKSLPLINFIGRNTLTVLGTHIIIIIITVNLIGIRNPWILLTVAVSSVPPVVAADKYVRKAYANICALMH